ncbi:MAG: YihY family inner membrane protein [Porticoccaceae bacterium]|nr:YihY family inner membrane protein [Porticoccaceae bacterium]
MLFPLEAILSGIKTRLAVIAQFFQHLTSRYMADGCRESAAALTYMSLFAVVPLMTLMYAMFSIIPSFQGLGEQVEQLLFENLMPQSGLEVQQYLRDFTGQARKLSSVGGFILVITSYLMLTNIEKTFNRIWGAVGGRRGLSSFLLYWGVLSFGPLLVGAGLIMHTYLLSFQLIVDEVDALGISALLLEYLPWVMTWAGFTLLFVAMPNCRVVGRYAMIGGLFTMILFELGKGLFGFLVTNSSYHTVYGAFAIAPLFLLWIYLCWMIILGGAELVRSLETFNTSSYRQRLPDLVALIMICAECLRRQQSGATLSDRDMIGLGLQEEQWRSLRTILLARQVLMITDHNTYVLARDPSVLTVWQLNRMLPNGVSETTSQGRETVVNAYPWYRNLEPLLNQASDNAQSLYGVSLQELLGEPKKAD